MALILRGGQDHLREPEEPGNQHAPSYQSIDPWALSIHQSIHNRRSDAGGIQDIDEVYLPDMLPHPIFLRQYLSQQPQRTLTVSHKQQVSNLGLQNTSISQQRRGQASYSSSAMAPDSPAPLMRHTTPLQALQTRPFSRPARTPAIVLCEQKGDQHFDTSRPRPNVIAVSHSEMSMSKSPTSSTVDLQEKAKVVRALHLKKDLPTIPTRYKLRQTPLSQFPQFPLDQEESLELRDYVFAFLSDTLPRQIYLHCLLRLPSLYFSRVDRIFTDADLTLGEIKDMALRATAEDSVILYTHMLELGHDAQPELGTDFLPPSYKRLKHGWESFIDNLMKEWKTLNIVSGLLIA